MADRPRTEQRQDAAAQPGSAWHTLLVFLKLGLTSFGGPAAHIGYFRTEFVERRRWITDREFADLVALCQFLPGPASSQLGFAIGLQRAGMGGALAAFVGFTLPSAVLLVAFAYGASVFAGPVGAGLIAGLKVVAVAIIAQAVLGMAKTLTPDARRASIAVVAAIAALLLAGWVGQVLAIVFGAVAGVLWCREVAHAATRSASSAVSAETTAQLETAAPRETAMAPESVSDSKCASRFALRPGLAITCLVVFVVLLLGTPMLVAATHSGGIALFDAMYRSGALVFGGGHVALPLLQAGVVDTGWVSEADFLAGYGAAQAVPGPLFTFAGYLGVMSSMGPGGVGGSAIALVAIFLPGFLLLLGVLPFWAKLRERRGVRAAMMGANASVVGILAAALYQPVFVTAIVNPATFCLALVCFVLLVKWNLPPWVAVIVGALGGVGLNFIGLAPGGVIF